MLQILHTGDIHLGAPMRVLGGKAKEHRRQLEKTFLKIIQTAISQNCQAVCIAGDLFDSNTPPKSAIDVVHEGFSLLGENHIFAVVLPGTHDFLHETSIYRTEAFEKKHKNVYVFNEEEKTQIDIPQIDTAFHANPLTSNASTMHPLRNLNKNTNSTYNIALAHGSIAIPGKHSEDDWPITLDEIAQSSMDYIALGHWHTAQEYSQNETIAWYCGSPEPLDQSQTTQGTMNIVEWNPHLVVKQIPISTSVFTSVIITVDQTTTESALIQQIRKKCSSLQRQFLTVIIKGIRSTECIINTQRLEELFAEHVYSIRILDTTTLEFTEKQFKGFPKESLQGQFITIMQKKIQESNNKDQKQLLEQAFQIGLAELQGRKIIEPE